LRAVAIAAVLLFHFPTREVVVGGLFGVDVFFALSGFLITALLLVEFGQKGHIQLRSFLARRGWRLLPALGVFLAGYLLLDAVFGQSTWFASDPFGSPVGPPISFTLAFKGVLAASTYTMNILRVKGSALPPITHLWSLSVEGQFYLVWSAVAVVLLRWARRWMLPITMVAAAASAMLPWFLWHGGRGANTIYFGTFTQAQALLIGSVVAQLWWAGYTKAIPERVRGAACGISFVVLLYLFLKIGNQPFKYLGALTVAAGASALIVTHLVEARTVGVASRLLSLRPVVWLGRRSYAIYLWHYCLDCWTNPLPHDIGVPLGMGASLVIAELSWRLVEGPAQRFARRKTRRVAAQSPGPTVPADDQLKPVFRASTSSS
jgi:peptidoglycan/LPS O-acetylase OafA/YrhL